jgi:predicted phage terminase large subunit-like protein
MNFQLSPAEQAALLRNDLSSFIAQCCAHLNPDIEFMPNWHIDLIASKVEACARGEITRLIINVPPRSLKSICVSVAAPAWILGHHPSKRIICASYGYDLALKLAQDCRSIMMSEWYQELFPTRLVGKRPAADDLITTAYGGRFATSVGGVLTGLGAEIIIIDDPLKPGEALTPAARQAANDWFNHTVLSRLNNKHTGCVIIIMQRLHLDDLSGHLIEQGGWEVVSLPAIAEERTVWTYPTLFGPQTIVREPGDLLHPAREPMDVLQMMQASLGPYHFAGQYQQSPVPIGGGLVKEEWLQYYDPHDLPAQFEQIIQSWDTAHKEAELNDYSVCTTWGLYQNRRYLLQVRREKMNFPALKQAVWEEAIRYHPSIILIEDKASGTSLIQTLAQEGLSCVMGIKPEGDKFSRMNAQTAQFANGSVWLPRQAPWLDAYRIEITTFPKARHDDQVDSTSQALKWMQEGANTCGLYLYYKELAGK